MSRVATTWALEQRGLKPAAKIVLIQLADHHNKDTGQCNPRIGLLAEECEMSRATVFRYLNELEERGLIERVEGTREGGGRTSSHYTLKMEASFAVEGSQNETPPRLNLTHPPSQNETDPVSPVRPPNRTGNINQGSEHAARDMLVRVLSPETADAFLAHRKALRKPVTPEAAKRLATKLAQCADPDAAVSLSIENGWTGVFPERQAAPRASPRRPSEAPKPHWQVMQERQAAQEGRRQ